MLLGKTTAALALAASLALPAVASAQYGDTGDSERPTIHVLGQVGAAQILRDLNIPNTAGWDGGIAFGFGAGMQFTPGFALRATFDVSPAEGTGETSEFYGVGMNRYFYGLELQARHITERGIAPYFLLGLGAATVSIEDDESFTRGAFKSGVGVEYMRGTSPLSYYAQAAAYLYEFDADIYKRDQVDAIYSVGVKYRLTK